MNRMDDTFHELRQAKPGLVSVALARRCGNLWDVKSVEGRLIQPYPSTTRRKKKKDKQPRRGPISGNTTHVYGCLWYIKYDPHLLKG